MNISRSVPRCARAGFSRKPDIHACVYLRRLIIQEQQLSEKWGLWRGKLRRDRCRHHAFRSGAGRDQPYGRGMIALLFTPARRTEQTSLEFSDHGLPWDLIYRRWCVFLAQAVTYDRRNFQQSYIYSHQAKRVLFFLKPQQICLNTRGERVLEWNFGCSPTSVFGPIEVEYLKSCFCALYVNSSCNLWISSV